MKRTRTNWKKAAVGTVLALSLSLPVNVMANPVPAKVTVEAALSELVPLRVVAESIGAEVAWNQETYQAEIRRGDQQLTVTIGEHKAIMNGTEVQMEKAAQLINELTMVPLEAIEQAFQADLDWDEEDGLHINKEDLVSLSGFIMNQLFSGNYSEIPDLISDPLKKALTPEVIQIMGMQVIGIYGAPEKLITVQQDDNAVHHNVKLTYMTANQIPLEITLRYNQDRLLNDLFIPYMGAAGYEKPSYEDPDAYTEKEVVIGEAPFLLPGTLTLPQGEGPFPVVVLVHGSGMNDRDEAVGAYKPFRDIAVGLAAQDVAVLRYEKRTREYPYQSSAIPNFTVQHETVEDALHAVKLLQSEDKIDPERIYLAGHSQGAMLVPRMIEADEAGSVAGAAVISGPSTPLEDILLWQFESQLKYAKENNVPEEQIAQLEQQVALYKEDLKAIKDPEVQTEPENFNFGNFAWWKDFSNYYGGELAKDQTVPLIIMQGDNDSQVPAKELDGWKEALSARNDVAYKLYPRMNHFLIEVDQPSTGLEYAVPGNVSKQLIDDLAEWIKKQN
ncbi:alpha/beta fold hydrolase [Paenibacillus sp. J2TS4]|uniref:alpha/beta hydrolase family protein n=1 Tax=Paenibacillus sp. J2TS4 TaxID=2807194 RepID=UPI001BD09965|nr:alpha/beta fold hydrolase [Paenibacillus sp. J2TS4]